MPLSPRHLGERGANLGALALQRLGQQPIEHPPQHALQHRLSERFALNGAIRTRRAVAVVDLVDGQRPQSRIARDLLGGERDLDPRPVREGSPRMLLDVAPRVGLDLIARTTLSQSPR